MHEADHARDHAELKLEMMEMAGQSSHQRTHCHPWPKHCNVEWVGGKICCDECYPEGSGYTYWITGSSSSDDSDADKENHNPIHCNDAYCGHNCSNLSRHSCPDSCYSGPSSHSSSSQSSPTSFHSAMREVDNTFRPFEESSSVGGQSNQPLGSDVDVNLQESATAETGTNENVIMN